MSLSSSDPEPTLRGPAAGQRVFGRYVLERILGRGGMGVVWAARDETLGERVALKFLPDAVRWDPAAFDDLKAETRRARSLTHPHIVRIHDFVEDAGGAAISMELVDGRTLTELRLARENKILEPTDIAPWLPQLCAALDHAHVQARVVHRDLKPSNLMLTAGGVLKVADFGVARGLADSISRVSMMSAGTLVYMSPQQAMGEKPAPSDDVYAVGATLYELLTGKPPFHTGDVRVQLFQRRPDTLAARRRALGVVGAGEIPAAWEKTIAACLAKDAADRPVSACALATQLLGEPAGASPAPVRARWRSAAVIALALGAGWGAWKFFPRAEAVGAASAPAAAPTALTTPARLVSRLAFDDVVRDEGGRMENLVAFRLVPMLDRHGRADAAMRFSGGSYVDANAAPALRWGFREPFSVAWWVRPDAAPVAACLLVVSDPQEVGAPTWSLGLGADLQPQFSVTRVQMTPAGHRPPPVAPLTLGRWHHLAAVSDGVELRLFVDGEPVAREPLASGDAPAPARARLFIGGGRDGDRAWFVGAMDEGRIYLGALTPAEVRALARAAPARFAPTKGIYGETDDPAAVLAAEFGPEARLADWLDLKIAAPFDTPRLADELGLPMGTKQLFVSRAGERTLDGRRYFTVIRFDGKKPDYFLAHDEIGGHVLALGSWYGNSHAMAACLPLPPPRVERADFAAPLPPGWSAGEKPVVESGRLFARGGPAAAERTSAVGGTTISTTWLGWIAAGGRATSAAVELTDRDGMIWVAACEGVDGGRDTLRITVGPRDRPVRVAEVRPTYGELRFTLVARGGSVRWRVESAGSGTLVADEQVERPGWQPSALARATWRATSEPGTASWLADIEWREEVSK